MLSKYIPMTESSCYVLLSVLKEEKHGYAIMKDIREMTHGSVSITNGTLYGILSRMKEDGLIQTFEEQENKIIYKITDVGREILHAEKKRIEELYHNLETYSLHIKEGSE